MEELDNSFQQKTQEKAYTHYTLHIIQYTYYYKKDLARRREKEGCTVYWPRNFKQQADS